jgi:O-acetyl-ADP-ribose deacetylase (regulator of RNase III)
MPVSIINGNIFTSRCSTLVNTVNCVGVMGSGIAFEFKLRYPDMYNKYVSLCEQSKLDVGLLWLYKSTERWVLNFPTKKDWKLPSTEKYLHLGLQKFVSTYEQKAIDSIAFPLLGADKGGISQDVCLNIMLDYLAPLPISIEIYQYDPHAEDDLYTTVKHKLLSYSTEQLVELTGIRRSLIHAVVNAMQKNKIVQLNQLIHEPGVGIKTLERLFDFAQSADAVTPIEQPSLLD